MVDYAKLAAVADRLIAENGFVATIQAASVATDPVTGLGGVDGSPRTVQAFQTAMDYKTFPDTVVTTGDRMMLFADRVEVGEVLVDNGDWAVKAVMHIEPDNASHIITKAVIRG